VVGLTCTTHQGLLQVSLELLDLGQARPSVLRHIREVAHGELLAAAVVAEALHVLLQDHDRVQDIPLLVLQKAAARRGANKKRGKPNSAQQPKKWLNRDGS
jgi:hypothetical protein